MIINSNNEWDKLKSIVVGSARGARFPILDHVFSLQAITTTWEESPLPQGKLPEKVIRQATQDLRQFIMLLGKYNVDVHRPQRLDFDMECVNYDWETDGMYNYCPRDLLLVVGNTVIETPMVYRSRQNEVRAYEDIKRKAIASGAVWIAAPRPTLLEDEVFVEDGKTVLTEEYPIFDAANVCRLGKDLLYLVSSTGNYRGAEWLQQVLPNHKVHIVDDLYSYAHIDSTIVPLEEGVVLLNGSRVDESNYPKVFKDWKRIYVEDGEMINQYYDSYPYASKWIGMNLLVIEPGLLVMEQGQPFLRKKLEKEGYECLTTPMRMARTLGGGLHCVTLDLCRE